MLKQWRRVGNARTDSSGLKTNYRVIHRLRRIAGSNPAHCFMLNLIGLQQVKPPACRSFRLLVPSEPIGGLLFGDEIMNNWKVDENKELPVAVIEDTENGFGICTLDGGGTASREELEKTAKLIAAAPDLLEALSEIIPSIKCLKESGIYENWLSRAEAAITKTET